MKIEAVFDSNQKKLTNLIDALYVIDAAQLQRTQLYILADHGMIRLKLLWSAALRAYIIPQVDYRAIDDLLEFSRNTFWVTSLVEPAAWPIFFFSFL